MEEPATAAAGGSRRSWSGLPVRCLAAGYLPAAMENPPARRIHGCVSRLTFSIPSFFDIGKLL